MIGWFMSQNIPMGGGTNLKFIPFSLCWNPMYDSGDSIVNQQYASLNLISVSFYLNNDSSLYTLTTDFPIYGSSLAKFDLNGVPMKYSDILNETGTPYPIELYYNSYIGIPSNKFITGLSAKFKITRTSLSSNKYTFDYHDSESGYNLTKFCNVNSYNVDGGITNYDLSLFNDIDQCLNCDIVISSNGW